MRREAAIGGPRLELNRLLDVVDLQREAAAAGSHAHLQQRRRAVHVELLRLRRQEHRLRDGVLHLVQHGTALELEVRRLDLQREPAACRRRVRSRGEATGEGQHAAPHSRGTRGPAFHYLEHSLRRSFVGE